MQHSLPPGSTCCCKICATLHRMQLCASKALPLPPLCSGVSIGQMKYCNTADLNGIVPSIKDGGCATVEQIMDAVHNKVRRAARSCQCRLGMQVGPQPNSARRQRLSRTESHVDFTPGLRPSSVGQQAAGGDHQHAWTPPAVTLCHTIINCYPDSALDKCCRR